MYVNFCEGCCLTLLKFKLGAPGREGFSEFKSFFRHLFHIRHFRQYIFYHYSMGFLALYPTIRPFVLSDTFSDRVKVLERECCVMHKFVHNSDRVKVHLRRICFWRRWPSWWGRRPSCWGQRLSCWGRLPSCWGRRPSCWGRHPSCSTYYAWGIRFLE